MHGLTTFRVRLGLIALGALAVRTAMTLHHRGYPVVGDALTFHRGAAQLAAGEGFRRIYENVPTAEHPPAFWVLLAVFKLMGAGSILDQKLLLGVVGTVTVVLIGILGRMVARDRAGLIAAALAAVYPLLWLADGSLMSESLYGPFVVGVLILAVGYRDSPGAWRAAALGAVTGLAALTRGEALLLVPLLGLALMGFERSAGVVRLGRFAAMAAAFALVIASWTIRNAVTFDAPVVISTNSNAVLAGSNCRATYYGPIVGLWNFSCYGPTPAGDEAQQAVAYRERGLRYARDHAGRVPVVLLARLGRVWDLYRPGQTLLYESTEGRPVGSERLGVRMYWLLLPFAVAGAVLLARRRGPLAIMLVPVVAVSLTAITTYGTTRFRFGAEPVVIVLAAVSLDAVWARIARHERAPSATAEPPHPRVGAAAR